MLPDVNEGMVEELKVLRKLAEKRSAVRQAAGGVFFDMHHNDVQVWQGYKGTGLSWDHPHRRGARTVEGDPVVHMRTQGLQNWFAPQNSAADILVREMMLLACETAASWCAERKIPIIFRGTMARPDAVDPDTYFCDVVQPAVKASPTGEMPMHLSIQYVHSLGRTVLRTTPIKHKIAGMEHYAKVTSPLRRYGDMIVHWQIEAALREEARTGRSLVTQQKRIDHNFLPFSPNVLDTIMLGLQPREFLISRSKQYANNFWITMLMFRAYHFGECDLPFATTQQQSADTGKPLIRVFIHTDQMLDHMSASGIETMLNVQANMHRPERWGLEWAKRGDVWECEMDHVDVYRRIIVVKPVRLVERPGA